MGNIARKPEFERTDWAMPDRAPFISKTTDVHALAGSILQSVSNALDGPNGIDPSTLVAALGALGGYSARWITRQEIEKGQIADDFHVPNGTNRPYVNVSAHVNEKVCDLTRESYASILISTMMAADANWLPNVRQAVMHNFMAINSPQYPDYTVDEKYWPKTPPQALLMMMWENHANILASTPGAPDIAMKAYAMATTEAAQANRHKMPMDKAGQIALETAIAMSKMNYGF